MSWKLFLYDWGGLNIALFQAINTGTPATLKPLAWFFGLVGSYWTAPLMLLGLWWWSKSATNPARGTAVRHRLIGFSAAFLLALLVATALKLWFDFPRPPAVLGDLARVIGDKELHYSLPSGHATYAAMVVGALWPLMGRRGRLSLMLYATLVGRNALSGRCVGGVDAGMELHGTRRVVAAVGRPCVAIGPPHIGLGLVHRGRQCCHDRSAHEVRHHPHVCLR